MAVGPIESFIRIIIQQNMMTDLEFNSILIKIIKGIDAVMMQVLHAATYILPDYTQFDTTEFVASATTSSGACRRAACHGTRVFHRGFHCRLLFLEDTGDRGMNRNAAFTRKVAYIGAIALLLLPIAAISQPATINPGKTGHSAGGVLAQLRSRYNLAQAELGEIDPASETMKLSTLGLRGVAANILWNWANYYKKVEDWDKLEMTVNQIIRLQPNFVEVWDFQAHNLSYNVSVEFDDYRMRYQWGEEGDRVSDSRFALQP